MVEDLPCPRMPDPRVAVRPLSMLDPRVAVRPLPMQDHRVPTMRVRRSSNRSNINRRSSPANMTRHRERRMRLTRPRPLTMTFPFRGARKPPVWWCWLVHNRQRLGGAPLARWGLKVLG